jgi:TrpR-related protein YerC/YecD
MKEKKELKNQKIESAEVNWNAKENKQLIQAFLTLKSEDEVKRFLRDLMTAPEIKEFSNRLETARLLTKDVQYNAIIESTGLSSTTIARIGKWLKGPIGGYRLVLNKLHHTHSQNSVGKGLSLH